jgi:hypothetical protein
MVPRIMASTPSTLPSLAAVTGSVRSVLLRFCSARSLSMALRSITLTLPSWTSLAIRRLAAAFPRSGALVSTKGDLMPPWTALSTQRRLPAFFGDPGPILRPFRGLISLPRRLRASANLGHIMIRDQVNYKNRFRRSLRDTRDRPLHRATHAYQIFTSS